MPDPSASSRREALEAAAHHLAAGLRRADCRIVFAESCTSGLVAASLSSVAGISQYLCGSAVTYRGATKTAWLGVEADDVARDSAVNELVARQMATNVLARTPESSLAVSITGHLGPDAPEELDGVVYIGVAERTAGKASAAERVTVRRHQLRANTRTDRQIEAATLVLKTAIESLASTAPSESPFTP